MIRCILACWTVFFLTSLSGQDLFGKIGKNFTYFDYRNTAGEKLDGLMPGTGTTFEAGVAWGLDKRSTLHYASSLVYNNYNASAYVNQYEYTWKTSYLGLKNMCYFRVYEALTSFAVRLKAGFALSHIMSGKQNNNGIIYPLTQNSEFKGVFIAPEAGVEMTYAFNNSIYVGAGYAFNKSWNLKKLDERLSFNNHNVYIGVYFRPKIVN